LPKVLDFQELMSARRAFSAWRPAARIAAAASILSAAGCGGLRRPVAPLPMPPDPHPRAEDRESRDGWTGRLSARPPLVSSRLLRGWSAAADNATPVSFRRTDHLPWKNPFVGMLVAEPSAQPLRIRIAPPSPIPISDPFDTIELWASAPAAGNATPGRARIAISFRDVHGAMFQVDMGEVSRKWSLQRRRVATGRDSPGAAPCELTAIDVAWEPSAAPRVLYLDELAVYFSERQALALPPRPAVPIERAPQEGRTSGERLAFPVLENTVVPRPRTPAEWRVEEADGARFRFLKTEGDHSIEWILDPERPEALLTLRMDGATWGAGFRIADLLGEAAAAPAVIDLREGRLELAYGDGLELCARPVDGSLAIEVRRADGRVARFAPGPFVPVGARIEPIDAPHAPPVLHRLSRGGDSLFLSAVPDWYRSRASSLQWPDAGAPGEFPALGYAELSDGRRRSLHERFVLTASADFESILPLVPHPPSEERRVFETSLWFDPLPGESSESADRAFERLAALSPLALVRETPGPSPGTNDTVRRLCARLLTRSPLEESWRDEHVLEDARGDWRPAGEQTFLVKPRAAAAREEVLGMADGADRWNDAVLVHSLASHTPWSLTDYDARAPGAGLFADAFYCLGEMLVRLTRATPALHVADGGPAWLYAGLVDAWLAPDPPPARRRLFPVMTQRLRSLSAFIGAGPPLPPDRLTDTAADRVILEQLAYGASGRVLRTPERPDIALRSLFLSAAVQEQIAGKIASQIAWHVDGRLLSADDILARPSDEGRRLYLRYPGPVELWLNGSRAPWNDLIIGADRWSLPPDGWVAVWTDGLAATVRADRFTVSLAEGHGWSYYDGRGRTAPFRGFQSEGPITVRREARRIRIDRHGGRGGVAIPTRRWGSLGPMTASFFDERGDLLGSAPAIPADGAIRLGPPPEAVRILLEGDPPGRD
jgi:hypothetical protein